MRVMCPPTNPPKEDHLISLQEAKAGGTFRIAALAGANCQSLREIGFCESVEVKKLSGGRILVCSVCGTRLAVSKDLAAQVMVKPVTHSHHPSHAPQPKPHSEPKG